MSQTITTDSSYNLPTKTNSLRDSKAARWTALSIVSLTMFCAYYLADAMSPLKSMVERDLGWSSTEYGIFTSGYGWLNVFFLMLIFGGILLDKFGPRITGVATTAIMVIGASLKYWAISTTFSPDFILFGIKGQVLLAGLGFAIFAVGSETAGIVVTKIIVKWFKGKDLAFAMGMQVSFARLGTLLALAITVPIANLFHSVSAPILFALLLLCIGLISFVVYTVMDKKLDASEPQLSATDEDKFKISDIWAIAANKGFWLIAILCVLFYSSVFPFIKFAPDLMINKFGVKEELAGLIPALLPVGTLILTPLFGNIYDRKGKGVTIMIIGAAMLVFSHFMFSLPFVTHVAGAVVLSIILGFALSLVPSSLWPSVSKIIPEKQLGTAYALIFWIQNVGLMTVPLLIGWVLDKYCVTGQKIVDGVTVQSYNYSVPMIIFMSMGLLAIIVGFMLKAEDNKKCYNLERPNIKK